MRLLRWRRGRTSPGAPPSSGLPFLGRLLLHRILPHYADDATVGHAAKVVRCGAILCDILRTERILRTRSTGGGGRMKAKEEGNGETDNSSSSSSSSSSLTTISDAAMY